MRNFKIEDKDFDIIQKRGYLNSRNFDLDMWKQVLGIESLESIEEESFSTLLSYIVDLLDIHLKYNDEKKHYFPHFGSNVYRSMIPENIYKEQAEGLFRNLNKIESPYIRSRIADILWYIKKLGKSNIEASKIAIKSYYKSVEYFINNCKSSKKIFEVCNMTIETSRYNNFISKGYFRKRSYL